MCVCVRTICTHTILIAELNFCYVVFVQYTTKWQTLLFELQTIEWRTTTMKAQMYGSISILRWFKNLWKVLCQPLGSARFVCFNKINAENFSMRKTTLACVLISIKRFFSLFWFNLFAKRLLRSMFAVGETKPKDNVCLCVRDVCVCFKFYGNGVVADDVFLLHLECANFANKYLSDDLLFMFVNPFSVGGNLWWDTFYDFYMGSLYRTVIDSDGIINRHAFALSKHRHNLLSRLRLNTRKNRNESFWTEINYIV